LPLSDDPYNQRRTSAWSSATSIAAGLLVLLDPVRVIRDEQKLERTLAREESPTSCAMLREAERLFQHAADNETAARSPRSHILTFLGTVGLGLILAYVLQEPSSAAMNTTIGAFLGQFMIETRPTVAATRLQSYRQGELGPPPPSSSLLSLTVAPMLLGNAYGLAVGGIF
jgi:hypothetical protein